MIKRIIMIAAVVAISSAAVMTYFAVDLYKFAQQPAGTDTAEKKVVLPPGIGFNSVLNLLQKEGLVAHRMKFKIIAQYQDADKTIKAGEYRLSATMSPLEILQKLVRGDVHLYRLTIPEGFRLTQIADAAEQAGFVNHEAFMEAAVKTELIHALGVPADHPEGYLFPDTYHLPMGISSEEIISKMIQRFWQQFPDSWKARATQLGFSIHQVVTLASIIEKETGAPEERPIISGVFHNRLKKKMRLESDPTVIYGIKDFNGNITKKDLRKKTPYNTYRIRGLPPGPIASPGKAAIEATLYPSDVPFLYFVSKKDGTHQFSKTIAEHNRAVRKYQLRK